MHFKTRTLISGPVQYCSIIYLEHFHQTVCANFLSTTVPACCRISENTVRLDSLSPVGPNTFISTRVGTKPCSM